VMLLVVPVSDIEPMLLKLDGIGSVYLTPQRSQHSY